MNLMLRMIGCWCLLVACAESTDCPHQRDTPSDLRDADASTPQASELTRVHVRLPEDSLELLRSNVDPELELLVDVEVDGVLYDDVELELHGGHSRKLPKKSYRLKFNGLPFSYWGEKTSQPVKRLVFQASWIDPTFLRNHLTFEMIRAQGGLAPRTAWAQLQFNDEPPSLYLIIERIHRPFLEHHGLNPDGTTYKASTHQANWADKANPLEGYELKINEDNPTDDLEALLEALSTTPESYEAFQETIEPVLNLDDFMRYQRVHSYVMDRDAFTKNYYLYHNPLAAPGTLADQFRIISWDADATWGISWDGSRISEPVLSWYSDETKPDHFSSRLLAIPEYREQYLEAYHDMLATETSPEAIESAIDEVVEVVGPFARADLEQWQPEVCFDTEIEALRLWAQERHTTMKTVIEDLE